MPEGHGEADTLEPMTRAASTIGFVMLHTSPLDTPGTKDAGGMNVVVLAQAGALAREGYEVRIYTRRTDPEVPARVSVEPGLTVIHLDAGPAQLLPKGQHDAYMEEFGKRLDEALEGDSVDLLHAEHWLSGVAAIPVARRRGIPLIQSYHSIAAEPHTPLTEGERPESPGRLAGERLLAAEADLVIAVSEAERQTVIERLGGDPDRVRVVPLGVDTELFHPLTTPGSPATSVSSATSTSPVSPATSVHQDVEPEDGSGDRAEVIMVGRLHPLKGFDLIVEAMSWIPEDARPLLRIVGAPPPDGDDYARELHDAVTRYNLQSSVVFEGALRRSELAARIRQATLMVVPSHSETFGLVALEAAASGVPVIARNAGGLREAVRHGETGMLVTGDDPQVWAYEITHLLSNPERIAQLGAGARAHALRRSWSASVDRLIETYEYALAAK